MQAKAAGTNSSFHAKCLQVTHTMADMIRSLSVLSDLLTNSPDVEERAQPALNGMYVAFQMN